MTFLSRLLMLVGISAAFALTLVDVRVSDTVGVQAEATGAVIGVVAMASGIAYLAYGRRSKRRWNSFARLFCGLCLFLPLLASIGGAAP